MMRKLLFLPLLFSLLVLSCGGPRQYPSSLLTADSLCDTDPQKALVWLDSISPQMLQAAEPDRMYFRLLRIKAADKAYITHTSDSLIRPLVEYYEQGGDPALLPTAYYYAGRTYMDLGDAPQAMEYLQHTLDVIIPDTTNSQLRGFCHTQIGRLCIKQDLNEEALKHYQEAYICFKEVDDTARIIYALSDISSAYNFLNQREKALDTLKVALHLMEESGIGVQPNVCNQLARTYHHLNQPDSARKYIQIALHDLTPDTQGATYNIACYIYDENDPQDTLLYCAQRILDLGKGSNVCYAHRRLAGHYARKGYLPQALHHYHQWAEMQDSISDANAAETVSKMQAMYNYQLREKENTRLKEAISRKHILILLLTSVCLLMTLSTFFIIQYNRRKREFLKLKVEKYMKMVEDNRCKKTEEETKERFSFAGNPIYEELQRLLKDKKHIDDILWQAIHTLFNQHLPNFHKDLSALTKMTRTNEELCMLIKMGFNPEEIAILLAKSRDAIYSMRKRLYKKAFGENGNGDEWDAVILSL